VAEHAALRDALGAVPSVYACYRFAAKLREFPEALERCTASVLARLREQNPAMGRYIAIDGSDMPATPIGSGTSRATAGSASGPATPTPHGATARQSARGWAGGYYGYKVHAAVCMHRDGLPVASQVETTRTNETMVAPSLIETTTAAGFRPETAIIDRGL
jgi:hypothetical protein